MKPLDVTDPRARRTLIWRQYALQLELEAQQRWWGLVLFMVTAAVDHDEWLWKMTNQLYDDAEKLSRYERQQKAKHDSVTAKRERAKASAESRGR